MELKIAQGARGLYWIEQRVRIVGVLYPGRREKFLREIERKEKREDRERERKERRNENDSIEENLDGIG